MIENEEIEKDIKKASSSYKIKLSSDDILRAYEKRQEEKTKKRFRFPVFKFAFGALTCASIIALSIMIPNILNHQPTTTVNPQSNTNWGTRSQTAFQLYTGLNLVIEENSSIKLIRKAKIDDTTFDDLVTTYDKSVDTLNVLFQNGLDKENTIEKGSFIGQHGTYQYRMTISQYIFLNNMSFEEDDDEKETSFVGEIVNDSGSNYYVEVKQELDAEDQEEEIEMAIHVSKNHRIEIEQEHEQGEVEYKYSIYEFDELTYEENISLENKKGKVSTCDIEVKKSDKEYVFEKIHYEKEILYCDYEIDDFDGELSLEYQGNQRIYKDKDTQKIKIIS